ncbi:hypothetical protein F7725_020142, partial [Dissostichus mawsoni]
TVAIDSPVTVEPAGATSAVPPQLFVRKCVNITSNEYVMQYDYAVMMLNIFFFVCFQKMRFSNCSSFWLINHQPLPHGACAKVLPNWSGKRQGPITWTACCLQLWYQKGDAHIALLLRSFAAENACPLNGCVMTFTRYIVDCTTCDVVNDHIVNIEYYAVKSVSRRGQNELSFLPQTQSHTQAHTQAPPNLHTNITHTHSDREAFVLRRAKESRTCEPYLSLTVHYVDNWELKSACLQTSFFPEDHTGEIIAQGLQEALLSWNLPEARQVCITTDNGSNIVKAVSLNKWKRLQCFGHRLHLAIVSTKNHNNSSPETTASFFDTESKTCLLRCGTSAMLHQNHRPMLSQEPIPSRYSLLASVTLVAALWTYSFINSSSNIVFTIFVTEFTLRPRATFALVRSMLQDEFRTRL